MDQRNLEAMALSCHSFNAVVQLSFALFVGAFLTGCDDGAGTAGPLAPVAPVSAPPLPVKTLASGLYDPSEFELKFEITGSIALPKNAYFWLPSQDRSSVIYTTMEPPRLKVHHAGFDGRIITVDILTKIDPNSSLDRQNGVPYSLLGPDAMQLMSISPEGQTMALVTYPVGPMNPVVVHGNKHTDPLGPNKKVLFLTQSPDGKRLAYGLGAWNDSIASTLVVDGQTFEVRVSPYRPEDRHSTDPMSSDGRPRGVFFSPDSKRYVAINAANVPFVDGQSLNKFNVRSLPLWSPDSKRWAFVGAFDSERVAVFVDGKPGKPYPSILPGSLQFKPDSQSVVYVVADGSTGPFFLVDGEKESKRYPYLPAKTWVLPDGRVVFNAGLAKASEDGKEPVHSRGSEPTFKFSRPGHVINGEERQRMILDVAADRNGDLAVVEEGRGRGSHWRNVGVVYKDYSSENYSVVRFLSFSPDGRHFAFVGSTANQGGAILDNSTLAVDGVTFPETMDAVMKELGWDAFNTALVNVRWVNDTALDAIFSHPANRMMQDCRRVRFNIVARVRQPHS